MAPSKAALLRAEESLQATLAQADQVVSLKDATGHAANKELLHVLELADAEVAKRLSKISPKPNGEMKFTAAQAIAYRTQIAVVIEKVKQRVDPIAVDTGQEAMKKAVSSGAKILAKLEQDFKGVSTSPRILQAMQQSHVLRGPNAALVTRVATSLDRYGLEMGQQFSRIIQVGLLSGATQDQMVATLCGHGGPKGKVSLAAKEVAPGVVQRIREGDIPEGLFVRHKYWAERIIRTETAYAFNGAKLEQLRQMKRDGLEVKKKIVAHFDNRTAPDSIAVHGQIRELEATFMDGEGRQYIQPPGRPNDRETLIPWFDDWAEVPSTEQPNPDELKQAVELANPAPKGAPLVPRSTEELHQLEQEARAAAHELEQRAAGRAAQEQANLGDDVKHAETMAAQALERIAKEQLAKQAALVKAAEDAEKAAKTKQQKQDVKDIKKQDKSTGAKMLAGEEHLAHLELIQLAHEKAEKFAKFINATKVDAPLPLEAITGAVKVSTPVLEALIKDALATYNDAAGVSGGTGLELFKHSDQFVPFVKKLALAKDAKSKKLYAALYASEGESWANALANVKELPGSTAKHLINKYKKPEPIPLVVEPPKPKPEYTIKPGGGTYMDVYVPTPGGGEKKLAYFHAKNGQFEVSPPDHLGMVAKTFLSEALAAEYAIEVGEAIAAAPKIFKKVPGKNSPFNHDPTREASTIGPINLAASAAKEIEGHRRTARAYYKKNGLKICEEDSSYKGCVDEVLEEHGLWNQQKKWSDGIGGCWYSSSRGPKSLAGGIVAHDVHPDHGKGHEDAKAMGKQVDDAPQDAAKYFKYSRLKYAATQEALELRRSEVGTLASQVDADGYVVLYRGIKGAQAQHLRQLRETGEELEVNLHTVSSWTFKREAGVRFATSEGPGGVVVRARVHISRIFSQFEQESIAMRRFGHGESEWIVIREEEKESVRLRSQDIENPHAE